MAKWGNCNFKELKKFEQTLEKMSKTNLQKFYKEVSEELAYRLLSKVIKRISEQEKEESETSRIVSNEKISSCVKELPIKHIGNIFQIDITNIVSNATNIEKGYKNTGNNSWIEGKFMLHISEKELNAELPKLIEQRLTQFINEVFK